MANQYLSQTQSQRQTQVMAPQLRQSLAMLQVPVLELQALIAKELEQNPTLDENPLEKEQVEIEPDINTEDTANDTEEMDLTADYEKLTRLDTEWKDYLNEDGPKAPRSSDVQTKHDFFMESLTAEKSLQEHLMDQLGLQKIEPLHRQLAEMIIGCIDEDGFIKTDLQDLADVTGTTAEEFEGILFLVQGFEPVGVGARDLRECLLIQLERFGRVGTPEYEIVDKYLNELGARHYKEVAQKVGIDMDELRDIAESIATLDPKPGSQYAGTTSTYILPEVHVSIDEDGEYAIQLNEDQIPSLRISRNYRRLMEDPNTPKETKRYVVDKIKAGEFLINSIKQRQDTIRQITTEIVRVQGEFFEHGLSHLRPLTMSEVADKIGKHETTVSRAVANKYMTTPRGTYEMKYFFTPGIRTEGGDDISNKMVKDAIQKLVDAEPNNKPLSDNAMMKRLGEQGIKVARRTIAKYREELNILPSHLRKTI